MKYLCATVIVLSVSAGVFLPHATNAGSTPPLELTILSSRTLSGTAGEYVTVEGQVKNTGQVTLNDITTYLSLVDQENKLPVDLEDWSAEKGLHFDTIAPGQSLSLIWKIHFIKAGSYSLIIVATAAGSEVPQVSPITHFQVAIKHNLNPGNILPVAFGTPFGVAFLLSLLGYKRRKEVEA